jgi:hypothetical protein
LPLSISHRYLHIAGKENCEMKCPECGSDIGPDEKFCGNCGAIVQPSEPSPGEEQTIPSGDEVIIEPPSEMDEPSEPIAFESDASPVLDETAYMPSIEPVEPSRTEDLELPSSPPPPPPPPPTVSPAGKEGKNRTALIIGIVVAVLILLCCCCVIAVSVFLYSEPGQDLLYELSMNVLPSVLALA